MPQKNLNKLFSPRSLAVIGASNRERTVGNLVMRNLLESGFSGPIMPINPKHQAVSGVYSYKNVASLPLVPDLAVICTPPGVIPQLITELGALGTRAAIIMTKGLNREQTSAGKEIQQAMLEAASPFQLRILGPNSLGLLIPGAKLNASFSHLSALPGKIAFVSQSGAMCTAVLDWARARNIGFSHFISLGDSADIDCADVIDYLGSDPKTQSILLYVESIQKGRKFMSAARAAARNKPLLVIKSGRTKAGAKAVAAHSGVITGSDEVYDAAIRRAGMLRVYDIDELFAGVESLARAGKMRGENLAILCSGSSLGIMAVDELSACGNHLANLSAETLKQLDEILPSPWSRSNPVDIFSNATRERYEQAYKILAQAPEVDIIMVIHAPVATSDSMAAAEGIVSAHRQTPCYLLTCWVGEATVKQARDLFSREQIATYNTPTTAVRAFMHGIRYRQNQRQLMETPESLPDTFKPDTQAAQRLVTRTIRGKDDLMTDQDAKALLAAYCIPLPPPDHGYDQDTRDYDFMIKVSQDPTFGPVITFGQGGPDAGLIGDYAVALPPLNMSLARDLITRTRISQRLSNPETDLDTDLDTNLDTNPAGGPETNHRSVTTSVLCQILVQVSQLIVDIPQLQSLVINPLRFNKNRISIETVQIHLKSVDTDSCQRLAIRPYPKHLEEPFILDDGRRGMLRPIRPEDQPNHYRLLDQASGDDLRYRFFGQIRRLRHSQMARLTQIDYDREMAFIAVTEKDGTSETLGVVRTVTDPNNESAEFAILMSRGLKGTGLSVKLMSKMIAYCRSRGTRFIVGQILSDNLRMLGLAKKIGFTLTPVPEEGMVEVRLELTPTQATPYPPEPIL